LRRVGLYFGAHYLPTYMPEQDGPPDVYYNSLFEQIELLDELGYDHVWVTEHHFHHYGGMIPDPPTFLAAAARSTTRIHLGVAVSVIPFHNPLQLAESYGMVDVISGGRLELGLGRGTTLPEFASFRIPRDDSPTRLRETGEILVKAWSGEPVNFKGEIFDYEDVQVLPRPVQRPHPRIWVGASSTDGTYRWAGQMGFHLMTLPFLHPAADTRAWIGNYQDELRAAGYDPATREVLGKFHLFVGETQAEVDAAVPYLEAYGALSAQRSLPSRLARPRAIPTLEEDIARGNVIAGTPERCIEIIRHWEDTLGLTTVTGTFHFGGMPQEMAKRNIRLFAEAVAPAFRPTLTTAAR